MFSAGKKAKKKHKFKIMVMNTTRYRGRITASKLGCAVTGSFTDLINDSKLFKGLGMTNSEILH